MALLIADISSHNPVSSWSAFLASIDGLIVKISEGVGYAWSGAGNALAQARAAGKCVGVYHFASAGDPVAEADYFLSKYSHQPGEAIILDWEPTGFTGDADAWAYAWCSRVIAATGVVPLVYMNRWAATQQSQWPKTRSLGCGLWAAWYGANTGQPLPGMPSFAPWPAPAMWQYTSNGTRPGVSGVLDLSQFYGSVDQWRAYGKGGTPAPTPGVTDMRLARTPDGTIWAVTDTEVVPIGDVNLFQAAAKVWGPPVDVTPTDIQLLQADADSRPKLVGYGQRIERIDEGLHGGWGYGIRIEDTQAKVTALGQAQAPVIDEAKLAAALLADPTSVAALGKAIADNLQLSPRSA